MRFGIFIPQGWRHDLVDIEPKDHWATMKSLAQAADAVLRRFPTWIRDVAEAIGFLIERGYAGVIHYSGAEAMTRYDMIQAAAAVLGWEAGHIRPSADVVPRRAARPRDSQLATDRIRALGFAQFTPFAEVVRAFARDFPEARATRR